eukprot:4479416-Pyramimonas_sp.AAC.1
MALADPWVISADWNAPFEDIAKAGFARQIAGALIKPDLGVTCGIARADFVDNVKLQAVRKVPWRTRCGPPLTLEGASRPWRHRRMALLKELATPAKPKQKAYPN